MFVRGEFAMMMLRALVLSLFLGLARAALAVGPHSMKMHLEWNRCAEQDEWEDWQLAFKTADRDREGEIPRHDLKRLFAAHFALVHARMPDHRRETFTVAEEYHFEQDVEHFLAHREKHQGAKGERNVAMGWDAFKAHMLQFMAHKTEERSSLLEVAQHIF